MLNKHQVQSALIERIERIVTANIDDFLELLRMAGLNPLSDLSGTNLSQANLRGINLNKADLSDVDFSGADLSYADLSEANLVRADFSGANLMGANLSRANLSGSVLRKASLMQANLLEANLERVDLAQADLYGAILAEGIAASPGTAEGPARVITSIEELKDVQPGEILVCPVATRSYELVFTRIRAAVTDMGGMMSHAAIVCREYGLPAVVGTGFATQNIRTGQKLRVDGTNGTVIIL